MGWFHQGWVLTVWLHQPITDVAAVKATGYTLNVILTSGCVIRSFSNNNGNYEPLRLLLNSFGLPDVHTSQFVLPPHVLFSICGGQIPWQMRSSVCTGCLFRSGNGSRQRCLQVVRFTARFRRTWPFSSVSGCRGLRFADMSRLHVPRTRCTTVGTRAFPVAGNPGSNLSRAI
jgi:hypothetical protein